MRQVAVVVEGQTEAAFVTQVVAPHLGQDVSVRPIITHTSRAASGKAFKGGGGWAGYARALRDLLPQPHWDLVTTMIDFYAYPTDAPGHDCHGSATSHAAQQCAQAREDAIRDSLPTGRPPDRWRPFVMLHELETLVIAAGSHQPRVLGDPSIPGRLQAMIDDCGGAELINDSPRTAPSKRLADLIDSYRKTRDGIDILTGTPLDVVAGECPRFGAWLQLLAG